MTLLLEKDQFFAIKEDDETKEDFIKIVLYLIEHNPYIIIIKILGKTFAVDNKFKEKDLQVLFEVS